MAWAPLIFEYFWGLGALAISLCRNERGSSPTPTSGPSKPATASTSNNAKLVAQGKRCRDGPDAGGAPRLGRNNAEETGPSPVDRYKHVGRVHRYVHAISGHTARSGPLVSLGDVLPVNVVVPFDDDRDHLRFGQLAGVCLGGIVATQLTGLDLDASGPREAVQPGPARGRVRMGHVLTLPPARGRSYDPPTDRAQ